MAMKVPRHTVMMPARVSHTQYCEAPAIVPSEENGQRMCISRANANPLSASHIDRAAAHYRGNSENP